MITIIIVRAHASEFTLITNDAEWNMEHGAYGSLAWPYGRLLLCIFQERMLKTYITAILQRKMEKNCARVRPPTTSVAEKD